MFVLFDEFPLISLLDAKGKELKRGAGQATVKYGYSVEGVAARGAGADAFAVRFAADATPAQRDAFAAEARSLALEPTTLDRIQGAIGGEGGCAQLYDLTADLLKLLTLPEPAAA